MLLKLHFTEDTFALQLLLQSPKGLIDVIVANANLHVVFTTFLSWICKIAGSGHIATPWVFV
ncbi:30S ribosomal protein S21 [Ketogulonicigenium vulgare WSH-001]|uniref:30S ribosomal protein S21 n=1 Tax=Ketogulonicigenium vulgare (strain WSH-001) TaxID=759362 RepID=F9Y8B2_KETVW|nr:30S ribosomal protein S21 [Ketogulonicigenium vulgare WSH-001]